MKRTDLIILFLFRDYFLKKTVPFPSNLLVAFYQPFTTYSWEGYPNKPPNKPMGFDVLRIYYPTRKLAVDQMRAFHVPLWNPYAFSGNTLLGTYQSAVLYPLSFLFFLLPLIDAWSVVVMLQPILAGTFMYFFLKEINLSKKASFFGSLVFAFSGTLMVWWEEVFMASSAILLLPLVLLAIHRLYKKITATSFVLLVIGLSSSILSGWFQTTFYLFAFSCIFVLFLALSLSNGSKGLFLQNRKKHLKTLLFIILGYAVSLLITSIHLFPAIEAYLHAPRSMTDDTKFISDYLQNWQHLITLIAPDYFGNPAVYNYFGKGFYYEKVLFFGIPGFFFALYELFHIKQQTALRRFFSVSAVVILSLGFSLPTTVFFLANLNLPFLSEMAPSRIFSLSTFCFATLAAFGIERYLTQKVQRKKLAAAISAIAIMLLVGWSVAIFLPPSGLVAKVPFRNLILPSGIFVATIISVVLGMIIKQGKKKAFILLILISVASITYFANKYLYFSDRALVFPNVPVLSELKNRSGIDRFWTIGDAYMLSNFATYYGLFSPEGYDSFNIDRYNELISFSHTHGNISQVSSRADAELNRVSTPIDVFKDAYRQRLLSLLGVRYLVVTKKTYEKDKKIIPPTLKKVWNDNYFAIFENTTSYPRAFLVNDYRVIQEKQKIADAVFDKNTNLRKVVILEEEPTGFSKSKDFQGTLTVEKYMPNRITINTKATAASILFISDNYFPGWKAVVDNVETKVYRVNYSFRAVVVPEGQHTVTFVYQPKSFSAGAYASAFGLASMLGVIVFLKGKQMRKSH